MFAVLTVSLRSFDLGFEAVEADDKAALVTHPVHVEQSGVAHVTHLTHPLNSALPSDGRCNTGHSASLFQQVLRLPHGNSCEIDKNTRSK